MSRGPLPTGNARRRNKPTIPTTTLPADGFTGEVPECPYELQPAGQEWWDFAWTLPQAAAWDDGAVYTVARRAQLEDDVATLDLTDDFDLAALLGMPEDETIKQLTFVIGRLKAMAGGKLGIEKEMRELDKRLGLDPKALAELRWTIAAENTDEEKKPKRPPTSSDRRERLSLVK